MARRAVEDLAVVMAVVVRATRIVVRIAQSIFEENVWDCKENEA